MKGNNYMNISYSVIPHVHWDREWYFTEQKSLLYLLHDLDEILVALESNPNIKYFLLDAQTSLIDDYLKYRPEKEKVLVGLIKEQRLLTGPWYTQCDQMIIHGESIVRNLLYGTQRAEELGHCMLIGYAVDCFGQAAQMPQIYQGFDIQYTIFKRGIQTEKIPSSEFIWESDDGSKIFAYHGIDYLNFRNPSENVKENLECLNEIAQEYAPRSLSKHVLLFNGFDQHPIRKDIDHIVSGLKETKAVSIDMDPLEKVLPKMFVDKNLPHYNGELTSGETGRVHKSIYSSRADIKTLNSKIENLLIKIVEPLQALTYQLTGKEERRFIKEIWKVMMENSAHDSIGSCNSDKVNTQIYYKFFTAKDSLEEFEAINYRILSKQISQDFFGIQLYNYLPYERLEEIEMTILTPYKNFSLQDTKGNRYPVRINNIYEVTDNVKKAFEFTRGANGNYHNQLTSERVYEAKISSLLTIGAMGYETFEIVGTDIESQPTMNLENKFMKISILENGSLQVEDKTTNHVYNNFLIFEDGADAGDSYDFSSTEVDRIITSENSIIENLRVDNNKASYEITMNVPFNLAAREQEVNDKEMKIKVELYLLPHKPQVDFKVTVENNATDHRVRALFKTDISSEYSYADQTFGTIKRPTYLPEVEFWKEKKWAEKPRTIEPMQSYMYLKNTERMVGLITDSVKEYQVVGENLDMIAYTLFRSFSKMGKSDLPDRPGRASGMEWETPDARLLKEMTFTFAIALPKNEKNLADLANEYLTPIRHHQEAIVCTSQSEFILNDMPKVLPKAYSAFRLEGDDTVMSIFKLGEKNGVILRLFQLDDGNFNILAHSKKITQCQLNELNDQTIEKDRLYKGNEIITIRMENDR